MSLMPWVKVAGRIVVLENNKADKTLLEKATGLSVVVAPHRARVQFAVGPTITSIQLVRRVNADPAGDKKRKLY